MSVIGAYRLENPCCTSFRARAGEDCDAAPASSLRPFANINQSEQLPFSNLHQHYEPARTAGVTKRSIVNSGEPRWQRRGAEDQSADLRRWTRKSSARSQARAARRATGVAARADRAAEIIPNSTQVGNSSAGRPIVARNACPAPRVDKAWPTERTSAIGIAVALSRR